MDKGLKVLIFMVSYIVFSFLGIRSCKQLEKDNAAQDEWELNCRKACEPFEPMKGYGRMEDNTCACTSTRLFELGRDGPGMEVE